MTTIKSPLLCDKCQEPITIIESGNVEWISKKSQYGFHIVHDAPECRWYTYHDFMEDASLKDFLGTRRAETLASLDNADAHLIELLLTRIDASF